MARIIIGLLLFIPVICLGGSVWPAEDPGTEIGGNLTVGYEPSGIIWHNERQTLFTVWDNGYITELDTDGNIVNDWYYGSFLDIESITIVDDSSNNVYLGVENPDSIIEFDISTGLATGKSWDLTSFMHSVNDNQGLEGLTYTGDGYFLAGLQETGEVFLFSIDLDNSGVGQLLETYTFVEGRVDLSDLFYNYHTNTIYILYDSSNYLTEINGVDFSIINDYYNVPGVDNEGFTMILNYPEETTTVFIAHDSGGVTSHSDYPVEYLDYDSDGTPDIVDCAYDDPTVASEQTYYQDSDGDGLGDPNQTTSVCFSVPPDGYTNNDDETYNATATGKKIKSYFDGTLIDELVINTIKPNKFKSLIYNFYSDELEEIVVLTKKGKKAKLFLVQKDSSGGLTLKNKKILRYLSPKVKVSLSRDKKKMIVTIGKKEFIYKITKQYKLKKL